MASDPWAKAATKQESEEQERRLKEKMGELKIKKEQRTSSVSSSGEGWPTLPDDGSSSEWGSNANSTSSPSHQKAAPSTGPSGWPASAMSGGGSHLDSSRSTVGIGQSAARPPALGGAGRGKPFMSRESDQTAGVGSFAALGTRMAVASSDGNAPSFGQFGTFGSPTSMNGVRPTQPKSTGFNFKTASTNADSKPSTDSGFGSFGGGSISGKSNWPRLENDDDDVKSKPASESWPNLGNRTGQQHNSRTNVENTGAGAAAWPQGPASTGGGRQEENWDDEGAEKPIDNTEISYLNKILHDKLINTKHDVEIERQNPNNPLFSVKSFEELRLSEDLLRGVYEMGFRYPSKIQESALPALLADPPQNMIAQSQSGTGKTAAFVLTMLSRVDPSLRYPQCLCLSPTYELALQIGKVIEQMGQFLTDVKVAYGVRGGFRVERGVKLTQQIIIGTPGTVLDWALKFRCFDPKLIAVFVLDEADLMIGIQGHQDQSIRIHKLLSAKCQHLLFSATYDDQVMDFAYKIVSDPVVIRLRREEETLDYIKQCYVSCRTREDKYNALCVLYGTLTIGQAIIFCRTKKEASWLAGRMSEDGHLVSLLTGELDIEQRAAIFERFKKGIEKVLISTNVTARGIDVQQVTIVINYDLPTTKDGQPDYEAYLHRIGRSGRFGKLGIAINFVDNNWSKNILDQIEAHFGKKIIPLDVDDVDALEKIENTE